MALNYTLKRASVMDGDEQIATVRGLSLNDITELMSVNVESLEALFAQFKDRTAETIEVDEITTIGVGLIKSMPVLMAQIIAAGADAYEGYDPAAVDLDGDPLPNPMDIITAMPMGIQLACLEKIGELTFAAGGGPKKVFALVLKAMQGLSQSGGQKA